jgi:hypothetical protein
MNKAEILLKIEILLEQLDESVQKQYSVLRSKKQMELLSILQEIKSLFHSVSDDNNEFDNHI